jgi:hypothetical protein
MTVPICPVLSASKATPELCIEDNCAFFIAPVKKCALYVLGHKSAIEIQGLQRPKA